MHLHFCQENVILGVGRVYWFLPLNLLQVDHPTYSLNREERLDMTLLGILFLMVIIGAILYAPGYALLVGFIVVTAFVCIELQRAHDAAERERNGDE